MNTTTLYNSNSIVSLFEDKKRKILEEKKKHPTWPQSFFSGQVTELDHWIKTISGGTDLSELIQKIKTRKECLERGDFPLRRGRMDNNRRFASIRLLGNLVIEVEGKFLTQ